jgi:hypothetical protein
MLGPVGAGLKEFYNTTLTFPTWSCEHYYTVGIDVAWCLCVCVEVNVINCDGSKDALVKRYIFHYWLCLLMACGI